MGRGKIEIKRIENPTNRQVTFSKRRGGLLKKAHELAILCDAQVGVVVFSASGKMFEYCSQPMSMRHLIERYQRVTNTRFNEIDTQQQILGEIARMKHENERLQLSMRQYTGDDLSSFTLDDLTQLEQQLEFSVNKVRERKHQLLNQQLDNLRRKEHILEDQNSYMYRMISENQHVLPDVKVAADQMQLLDHFGNFYPPDEESSRPILQLSPQLHPYRLQPTQPNLHQESTSLPGHSLQLWYIILVLGFHLLEYYYYYYS